MSSSRLTQAFSRLLATLFIALVATQCVGCMLLSTGRYNAADRRFALDRPSGPTPSANTTSTLQEFALTRPKNAEELASFREFVSANPTADLVYAYAESAYIEARRHEKGRPLAAQRLYFDVISYSWHFLFNPHFEEERRLATWNGRLADALLLYNGASERFLHLALADVFKKKTDAPFPFRHDELARVQTETSIVDVRVKIADGGWRPDEFGEFRVAADCPVKSLNMNFRKSGLGTPLVVQRLRPTPARLEEKYYSPNLFFPATALLRPVLPNDEDFFSSLQAPTELVLEIYDPLKTPDLVVKGSVFPLESDLTTPLAYHLTTRDKLNSAATRTSLLNPEELQATFAVGDDAQTERQLQGLYLFEPYDPNKIPVVMTHGLASSPVAWMEMYNAVRSDRGLQTGFQFWFFFYPSGQPFWASAATLRRELNALEELVDPNGESPALKNIVLIGHSMGGLVSRMQVQESGDRIWNLVSHEPVDSFNFDDETRRHIEEWFFFEPNPNVARVVTIATPFHGSDFANAFTKWIAERAIDAPQTVLGVIRSSIVGKKQNLKYDPTLLETTTSVDSLAPDCPIFRVLDSLPIPSSVALNNIVGVLPSQANRKYKPKKTDGVVDFESARRNDVESEFEAPASHTTIHSHFDTINEVRRILGRHLALYDPSRFRNSPSTRQGAVPTPSPSLSPSPYPSIQPTQPSSPLPSPKPGPTLPPEFYSRPVAKSRVYGPVPFGEE